MHDLSFLRPVPAPVREFQNAGFPGELETYYEFELDQNDAFFIEKAFREASDTRKSSGDATYFYILGYIIGCKDNFKLNKILNVGTTTLDVSNEHLALIRSALFEYRSNHEEKAEDINAVIKVLYDAEPYHQV